MSSKKAGLWLGIDRVRFIVPCVETGIVQIIISTGFGMNIHALVILHIDQTLPKFESHPQPEAVQSRPAGSYYQSCLFIM
jgi:hypothetical protein